MDLSESNKFCSEAGITSSMLFNEEPFPSLSCLKKGLILELLKIKKSKGTSVSWPLYKGWIQQLLIDPGSFSVNAFRKSVSTLESQGEKTKKHMNRFLVEEFMQEQYKLPGQLQLRSDMYTSTAKQNPPCSLFDQQVTTSVNKSLAAEITLLKEKQAVDEQQLILKDNEIQKIKLQLSKVNPRNVNRKIRRKEDKISKLLLTIKSLKHENHLSIKMKHSKTVSDQIRYYKAKCKYLSSKLHTFECTYCNELEAKIIELKKENAELLNENAELMEGSKSNKVNFYCDRKYADELRMCIMELLSYNVGILKIEPVIRAVFNLLNIECDKLPKHTTINEMLIESRTLSHMQIAEALTTTSNNTLHSDGTTKFGHKYQSYQVTTSEGSLTLGLQVSCIN